MVVALTIFFFCLLAFSVIDYVRVQAGFRTILLILSCCVLVFFITFRFNVPDYDSYVDMFREVTFSFNTSANSDIHGEFGYLFFNALIKLLGGNPIVLFAVVGSLSILFTAIFYRKYTGYFLIALLGYFSHIFLLREMIQIRSGLAITITMFAIPYVQQRKLLKFLGVILVAASFHMICLLFVAIYFLYPVLQKPKYQIMVIVAGLVLGLTFNLSIIETILTFFNAPPIVIGYLYDEQYNFSLGLLNPMLLKNLVVITVLIKQREFFIKNVKHFNVLLVSYIIGTFWLSAFSSFAIFSARIATMFSNVEHVLLPSLLLLNKYKLLIYVMIILFCIFSFFSKWNMLSGWTFVF